LLAADLRLGELMKKLNEMEGNISSLNRRIMLLEVSIRNRSSDFANRDFRLHCRSQQPYDGIYESTI
jgi:hypothetical protein